MKKVLITGSAGFIGFHLCRKFLSENYIVHGIDNLNNYYSTKLKNNRNAELKKYNNFKFYKFDLKKQKSFRFFFKKKYDFIFHLAAQPGVRFSITDPQKYIDDNILAFSNILEICKNNKPKIFYFASSSSVYGDVSKISDKRNNKSQSKKCLWIN